MTARVLIVCGHVGIERLARESLRPQRDLEQLRRGTGSRGEREWTGHVGPILAERLRARGVEVIVHDATYAAGIYGRDYDLLLALHYMRDSQDSRAFAGIPAALSIDGRTPYITEAARAKAQRWVDRLHHEYPIVTGIPATPAKAATGNITHHYLWDFVSPGTPCVLLEAGHADIDAALLFEPGVARVVGALDLITAEYLEHDLGLLATPPAPPGGDPYPLASFPVAGLWGDRADALEAAVAEYSERRAPEGLGRLYAEIGGRARVRADVLVAQAMHETGRFRFDGTDPVYSAKPEWSNWCGLKTSAGDATARFATPELGVKAHAYHMAWYVHPDHQGADCSSAIDPRHFGPGHRASVRTIHDLGGKWAPSGEYGRGIARHLAEIRARVASWTPAPAARELGAIAVDLERLAHEIRAHI